MYTVEWLVEKRIVITQAIGDQTKETVADSVERLQALMNDGIAPIHVISDSRRLGKFPTDLSLLRKMVSPHEKSGYTIVVGGSRLSKFVSTLLTQFSGGGKPEFKEAVNEGIHWLQAVDATLPTIINYDDTQI